jgi:hypothetical protein
VRLSGRFHMEKRRRPILRSKGEGRGWGSVRHGQPMRGAAEEGGPTVGNGRAQWKRVPVGLTGHHTLGGVRFVAGVGRLLWAWPKRNNTLL